MRLTAFICPTIMFISFILIFLGLILIALILPTSTALPYLTATGASPIATTATVAIATALAGLVSRLNLHAIRVVGLGSLTDLCHQAADILQLISG